MKVALIGNGYWGKILRKYIETTLLFELVRIYSRSENSEALFTNDINTIAHDPSIEGVFIASPLSTHFHFAKLFLENGKHVFCEKPTTEHYKDFLELMEISKNSKRTLYTNYIYLCSQSIQKIKELLPQIGYIQKIECNISQYGKFYTDCDVFGNIGIHMLSVIIYLFDGKISPHSWTEENFQDGLCVEGEIHLLAADVNIKIISSIISEKKIRTIEIVGEEGEIHFDLNKENVLEYKNYGNSTSQAWNFPENNNIEFALADFYQATQTAHNNPFYSEKISEIMETRFRRM